LREGKYEVRVFVEEFHLGTSNKTGSELESFAYFTVKPKSRTNQISFPETDLFFVLLIVLTVVFLLNKNKGERNK